MNRNQHLQQQMDCPVCMEQFQTPKQLPCQHTFCLQCLQKINDSNRGQHVECPECRQQHRMPANGIAGFPDLTINQRSIKEVNKSNVPQPQQRAPPPRVSNESPQERGLKLIDALLRNRNHEAIKILKEKEDVDLNIETTGDYAIHLAARRGYVNVITAMKDKGADLEKKNMDGECPLHEAVKTQTMDVIEELVDLGMDTNVRNEKGETPLHTALKHGAVEAMEALLIKKAQPDATDSEGRQPKDVAKNSSIKDHLRINSAVMMSITQSSKIMAKSIKIQLKEAFQPIKINRVGIVIEVIDTHIFNNEYPIGFYFRREKTENTTIALPANKDETLFSDVFNIRLFGINRNVKTKIFLPVFQEPGDKQQMVARFITPKAKVEIVDTCVTTNKVKYCLFEITFVPETTCTIVIYVRPKKETNTVTEEGCVITSKLEKAFSLNVPPGSFEEETELSLMVFETNENDEEKTDANDKAQNRDKLNYSEDSVVSKTKSNLITDIFQINITGQQPKKGITVQIPLCEGLNPSDEIAIVHADENDLDNEGSLEIIPVKPQIIDMNLVFEVEQFCIYVASWNKQIKTNEEKLQLQREISMTRNKKKPASLFAVIKHIEGLRHSMVVECVASNKSNERRRRWEEIESYEIQTPAEIGEILMTPGDTFYVNVEGDAYLEEQSDSTERKLQFCQVRSSWQQYYIHLKNDIYEDDKAFGFVTVSKNTDTGLEKCAILGIKLTAPPRSSPSPSPSPSPHMEIPEEIQTEQRRIPKQTITTTTTIACTLL